MMESDDLRDHLLALLRGGNAHMTLDEAVADYPLAQINERPPHVAYTPWQLLEHMRLTQRDILEFMADPAYHERHWPQEYWPAPEAEATPANWHDTLAAFRADAAAIEDIVLNRESDLSASIHWGSGQTLLREILLVADHNAYHTGEFAILRQAMQTWPPERTADA
jgi:hypothetical protein